MGGGVWFGVGVRVLIIKPSSLGDIVHAMGVVQGIVEQVPEVRLTWVARDRFAPLVEAWPAVERVVRFERSWAPAAAWRLRAALREAAWDWVLDMQGLLRSGLMLAGARAPRGRKVARWDAREGAGWFAGQRTAVPAAGRQAHAVAVLREFLPVMGLSCEVMGSPRLKAPWPEVLATAGIQAEAAPVVLFPDSRRAEKEWPYFGPLAGRLRDELSGQPVIWAGGAAMAGKGPEGVIDVAGRTSLAELAGLVQAACLVIANDSGPVHIAAMLGRPVLGLYGPTPPELYGPWPLEAPQNHVLRAPGGDLKALTVEQVLEVAGEVLG